MRFGDCFLFYFSSKLQNQIPIYAHAILYLNLDFGADHISNLVIRDRGKWIC